MIKMKKSLITIKKVMNECPNCGNKEGNVYYCCRCGEKLKDFRRIEIKFAVHTEDKDKTFDRAFIGEALGDIFKDDICNLSIEEVEPMDWNKM